MDQSLWNSMIRALVEYWGRRRKAEPIEFQEEQIVWPMKDFRECFENG
jgi:hypothetical protein